MGSIYTAATSPCQSSNKTLSDSISLYSNFRIIFLKIFGIPSFLLVITVNQSCHTPPPPQYAILLRLVIALAARIAAVPASEPVLAKRTISAPGIIELIFSDASTSRK